MCGIAGIWYFDGRHVDDESLRRFTDSMAHRGPDGFGLHLDDNLHLGLGHRRLAILDLSENGKQPMSFNGDYWLVHNGEIFNFLEIREELQGLGYRFKSETDTEVILAAYDRWGTDCQLRFNGMWAFALWDRKQGKLFLSRDRFGIKPLYYAYIPGKMFAFASETGAFRHLTGFRREFDKAAVAVTIHNVFSLEGVGRTIFRGIRQVLPGHSVLLSTNETMNERRWWCTRDHVRQCCDPYDLQVRNFQDLFLSSCRLRIRSDVKVATALSGGLDSSSVYCMLRHAVYDGSSSDVVQRLPPDWRKAFIAGFPGTRHDEREYAGEVVKRDGGEAVYVIPSTDNRSLADSVVSDTLKADYIYLSPPVAGDIYRAMAEDNVKVSLDGHGVDEMLFGYEYLVKHAYVDAVRRGDFAAQQDFLETFVHMHHEDAVNAARNELDAICRAGRRSGLHGFYDRHVPAGIKNVYRWFARHVNPGTPGNEAWLLPGRLETVSSPATQEDKRSDSFYLDDIIYRTFHTDILPVILRNFDRASMQHGVEIRMPFMDWRLVVFVFGLPLSSKVGRGYTKRILRDAMRGVLPDSIRERRLKIGLNAPMREWFYRDLREYLLDTTASIDFVQSDIWNGPRIRDFVKRKTSSASWTWDDCTRFWPYISAHILMSHS